MAAPPDLGRRLFDYFLVVGVGHGSDDDSPRGRPDEAEGRPMPYLKYRFPQRQQTTSFMKSITEFCFPDASTATAKKSETFSFVLTETNGEKSALRADAFMRKRFPVLRQMTCHFARWGYCRRTAPLAIDSPGPNQRNNAAQLGAARTLREVPATPLCFCIISFIPCFKMFSHILDEMIKRAANDSTGSFDSCTIFLNAIYQQPLPAPGGTLTIHVPVAMDREDKERYDFTRPDDSDSLLEHVNFEPYLRHMDPLTIVSIFVSMLIERRFIFVASRLSTLSACVQAAVALLYPFSWQHIFIPVLPRSLLTFCCAPMPFCIGILRDSVAQLKKMSDSMEEVILVDIDNNKLIAPHDVREDIELLPPSLLEPLVTVVTAKCKEVKSNYSLWHKLSGGLGKAPPRKKEMPLAEAKNLANGFIAFMVDLLGSYRAFLDSERNIFDKESFVSQQPAEFQPFLALVSQSQMFEMFVADRLGRNKNVDQGRFERRVTKLEGAGRIRVSRNLKQRGAGGAAAAPVRRSKRAVAVAEAARPVVPARSRFTMYENGELTREQITREEREAEKEVPGGTKEKKRESSKRSGEEESIEVRERPQCKYGENCRSDNPHHWVAYQHTPSTKHPQPSSGAEDSNGVRKRVGGKGMGFFLGKLLGEILDDSPLQNAEEMGGSDCSPFPTATATLSYVSSLSPNDSDSSYASPPASASATPTRRPRAHERVIGLMKESEKRRSDAVGGVGKDHCQRREEDKPSRPPLRVAITCGLMEDERPPCPNGVLCRSHDPTHWVRFQHTPSTTTNS